MPRFQKGQRVRVVADPDHSVEHGVSAPALAGDHFHVGVIGHVERVQVYFTLADDYIIRDTDGVLHTIEDGYLVAM